MTNKILRNLCEQNAKQEYAILKYRHIGWMLTLLGLFMIGFYYYGSGNWNTGPSPVFIALLLIGTTQIVQRRTVKNLKQYIDILEEELQSIRERK